MNVESLKTELQQVLDNDVALRKEFNELKRSLSDYRNQLIMRDEDCKRLQVTIDILNTKLVVMERDNTNYKAELTSFKELRSTIKDQLQAKQDEIEARLQEIQGLRSDLSVMAAGYEQKMQEARLTADAELERVTNAFRGQIDELNSSNASTEAMLRQHFEGRLNQVNSEWQERESALKGSYQQERDGMLASYQQQLDTLKSSYEARIAGLSEGSQEEINKLITANQETLSKLESDFNAKYSALELKYTTDVEHLRASLEEQRSTLTTNFNNQIESQRSEFESSEARLREGYEQRIAELQAIVNSSKEEISAGFANEINQLRDSHAQLMAETIAAHESRLASLINEYEEKLSVTLIHSNAQNSKLNDELAKTQAGNEVLLGQLHEMGLNLEAKNGQVESLSAHIANLEALLKSEADKYIALHTEFEAYRQSTSLSVNEQVAELTSQIASLNLNHSDYVNELTGRIENLNTELTNLGGLFESNTNALAEAESNLEQKVKELESSRVEIAGLQEALQVGQTRLEEFKADLQLGVQQQLQSKEVEFQKLLAENTNLISEIDEAQGKVESLEAEVGLLRSELEDVRLHNAAKANDYRETLATKNFEITNLEANNAALQHELKQVKQELASALNQLQEAGQAGEEIARLHSTIEQLTAERTALENEIGALQDSIRGLNGNLADLNTTISTLNSKIEAYEQEIATFSNTSKQAEQEAFIDRLFKQIDNLNDERLALLNEKEQMANQLLKMNDVVGAISQQVDSEKIDVTDLNNHRKNVILASNSGEVSERSQMKEQINDLVREIDKCIALLSA